MIGKTVAHYRIVASVGRGGMGVVYKALDQKLGRHVAIKFLSTHLSDHAVARLRFTNEARMASSLEHPNICTIHEIGESEDGQIYIVMPFYEGRALSQVVRERPSIQEAVGLVRQAALGLSTAHSHGIIHRDVKSQNLFVTGDGHLKVLDFGIAKLADSTRITQAGSIMGTLQYMAPEQARGEEADVRSDVYALGVVLYELLTGSLPFEAGNQAAALQSILTKNPRSPSTLVPEIEPALAAVVLSALAKSPADRPADMETFRAVLAPFEASGRKLNPDTRRPRRVWILTAAIGLTVFLAALGILHYATPEEQPPVAAASTAMSLAILPLENLSGDVTLQWMERAVVELLNSALSRSHELRVIDSQKTETALARLRGGKGGSLTTSQAEVISREIGAGSLLSGFIVRSGQTLRIEMRRFDVNSGAILRSVHADGTGEGDLFAMVASLTDDILADLAIARISASLDEAWLREITTSSVDAYRDYIQGRSFFLKNEHLRAKQYFESAIARDPNFVMAHVDLMGSCFNLEDFECIGTTYEQARRLRETASRREKLCIDLIGGVLEDDAEQQIMLSTELLTFDPTAQFWRYILGRGYFMSDRPREALAQWEPLMDERYAWVWTYIYASQARSALGHPDQALEDLNRGFSATSPNSTNARARLHSSRGRVYRELGRFEQALADFDSASALDPILIPLLDFEKGKVYISQQNYSAAREALNSFVAEQNPMGRLAQEIAEARSLLKQMQSESYR